MLSRAAAIISTSYIFFISLSSVVVAAENITLDNNDDPHLETALAKLVRMFSAPGAFERVNSILGENSIEESSSSSSSCPKGEEGLDCRRAEARRSVDCPHGDCYCYNCAAAGPEMWAPCCREGLKCCSYLAAACRNCDHPSLYPFCSKHFKKCLSPLNRGGDDAIDNSTTLAAPSTGE